MSKNELIVSPKQHGAKLRDVLLSFDLPSSKQARKLLDAGSVSVNGEIECFGSRVMKKGDLVTLRPRKPSEALSLQVLYEDDSFIAVSKPSGCISTREALAKLLPPLGRYEMVHRLDKETSGVLLLAKSEEVRQMFETLFRNKEIEKTYVALVHGKPSQAHGIIRAPLALKTRVGNQVVWHIDPASPLHAETEYWVKATGPKVSCLQLIPKTGRTHQIRVHMASSIGCPIVGDKVYGKRTSLPGINRHMLHASSVRFSHPVTHVLCVIRAPLPADFKEALQAYMSARAKELVCEYS